MDIPEEMRVIYIFCREATLTKYFHTPKYNRFKYLASNIYHFVGLDRTLEKIKNDYFEALMLKFIQKKAVIA
jgi:hypothetical protein